MDEATSGGWNASQKRKRFLIAAVTEGYVIFVTLRCSSSGSAAAGKQGGKCRRRALSADGTPAWLEIERQRLPGREMWRWAP